MRLIASVYVICAYTDFTPRAKSNNVIIENRKIFIVGYPAGGRQGSNDLVCNLFGADKNIRRAEILGMGNENLSCKFIVLR